MRCADRVDSAWHQDEQESAEPEDGAEATAGMEYRRILVAEVTGNPRNVVHEFVR